MNSKINILFQDCTGKSFSYKSLSGLTRFFDKEHDYWNSKDNEIRHSPKSNNHIHQYVVVGLREVRNVSEKLDDLNKRKEKLTGDLLETEANQILNNFSSSEWLCSKHPFTDLFVECHKEFGFHGATKFFNFVTDDSQTKEINEFYGEMLAYEFKFQGSDLTKRRKTEKSALSRLANQLGKVTEDIFSEAETAKSEYIKWHKKEVQEKWEHWFKLSSEKYDKFIEDSQNEKAELVKEYEEHLRIEKPAECWKTSASKFLWQGLLSLAVLFVFVGGGIWFSYLMYDSWADIAKEQLVNLKTFHGVIIFATMVTFFGFGIRVLSKLVFSSFHLMRDAQERNTLAILYLSLSREKAIDEKSRDIVLQALFSRAEIGLIGSSSSPTLPSVSDLLVNKD